MTYTQIAYDVADHWPPSRWTVPTGSTHFTATIQRELCAALDAVDADPEVRVVVVTGRDRGV